MKPTNAILRQIQNDINEQKNAFLAHVAEDANYFDNFNHKFEDLRNSMILFDQKLDKLMSDSEPVNQWFKNATYTKMTIMWIIGLVGAIIGIAIGIKKLLSL